MYSGYECLIEEIKRFELCAWHILKATHHQNPTMVNTKFSRNITSYFIGNAEDIYHNFFDWMEYLKSQGFKEKD